MKEWRVRQLGIGRIATTGGAAALLLLALAGPAAAAVDLGNLSADDMRALQRILETERTNAAKRLPSGMSVTVIKTQTSPRVCRVFRIGRQGQEGQAVGCRIGAQRWALNASIDAAQAAPVDPSPEQPVVRPKVVAQSRPVQNSEDEGVEEAGATPAPPAPVRSAAPQPVPDAGRTPPAETQVAALPRAPFQGPKPLARPDAPDSEPAAAGPTQAPIPRARPVAGSPTPAATASPQPAAPPVVEIDPSLRVLTSPPAVPPPLPRPGPAQPAAVAAAPAEPVVAAPVAPAPPAAPAPATPNPVAAAPAPKEPESLINVPPAAFAQTPAVEALLPRTDAAATVPAPFTVPPPRSRPVVAAAHPAQGVAPPATRPPPPAAVDVPVPRRRPG
ncbi:MAG: hypothetical protein ACRC67_37030 [Inquilinus sp.]|uniref:hypothetical protein n=1 Tax=Inquilinus sp. TaxID=1932117 RepID=UPI003F3109D6